MDNELFELCKEVYKRTGGWGTEENALTNHKLWHPKYSIPIYTSDYLLEKLPFGTELGQDSFAWIGKWEQGAGSATKRQIWERADTPLKALLKLTIALHEAGELR